MKQNKKQQQQNNNNNKNEANVHSFLMPTEPVLL